MIASILSFIVGVLIFQQLERVPDSQWFGLLIALILITLLAKWWRVCLLFIGFAWAFWVASEHLSQHLPEALAGKDIRVQGKIVGLPAIDERKARFDFLLDEPKNGLPEKIRLSWYYPETVIKADQFWQLTVRLKPPHGNFNPGGFDYEQWLFVQNIGATGYVRKKPNPVLLRDHSEIRGINILRQKMRDRLDKYAQKYRFIGFIKALTIGDKSSISQSQWQVLRRTGTVHLMAISGLHIGLISGMLFFLVLKIWVRTGIYRWLPAKIAALAAIIVAVFYSSLAGFSVPTQRALIMLSVVMLAIFSGKHLRPFHTWALAILFVVLIDPLAVLSAGFWLSFTAVGLIIFVLSGRLRKPGAWQSAIKIHLAIAIGLSPLLLWFFQQTSLIAPVANLIAVPIVGLIIVPLSLLASIGLFVAPAITEILLQAIDLIFQILWYVLVFLAELPIAVLDRPQPEMVSIVMGIIGILWLMAPKGIPSRWLGSCLILPLIFPVKEQLQPGEAKLTLLDVGQGLSAVVQTAKHTLVFDTGAKYSERFDSGASVVLPFLRFNQIDRVDMLVISHGDNDHIGGARSLVKGIEVKKLLTSVPKKLTEFKPVNCRTGQNWQWDDVNFLMLWPEDHSLYSENDNSCVLLVTTANGKYLLTGDIEESAESRLVETYGDRLQADVLISPHHGSKTSSSIAFLQQLKAKIVLLPAGYRNRFGFPHPEILERYQNFGVKYFNTAENGAISVKLGVKAVSLKTWRDQYRRYWNK